ncbi:MAG: TerB N-terminal domain-containing protein [Anaerolineales bacterium]|nr:TerB N-terminal domain-containing protein [Anaerolineales bacterium]
MSIVLFILGSIFLISGTFLIAKPPSFSQTMPQDEPIIAVSTSYSSRETQFVVQAHKNANRTGNPCQHVPFKSYWPTYADMSKAQTAWYFYWREQVRNQQYPDTSLSYIFLHVYELINNVGVANVEDGYQQLRCLWVNYRDRFENLDYHLSDWLIDYLFVNRMPLDPLQVYNDPDLLPGLARAMPDLVLHAFLVQAKSIHELPLFLLEALTDYQISKSKFYQSGYADVLNTTLQQVLAAIDNQLRTETEKGIFERYQPKNKMRIQRSVFQSALYTGPQKMITVAQVYPYTTHKPLRMFLTAIVKRTENHLRQHYRFSGRLKEPQIPGRFATIIESAISLPTKDKPQAVEYDVQDRTPPRRPGVAIPVPVPVDSSFPKLFASVTLHIVSRRYIDEAQLRASTNSTQQDYVPLPTPFTSYNYRYDELTNAQTRWYFYWRDQVRQKKYLPTDQSYIVMHATELVHQVGAESADDAYSQLQALWHNYRQQHGKLEPYLLSWMLSFVSIHACSRSPREVLLESDAFDFALSTGPDVLLARYLDTDLFKIPIALLEQYVDHDIRRSSFYKSGHQALIQQIIPGAVHTISVHHANMGKGPLFKQFEAPPSVIEIKRCWQAEQTYGTWPTQLVFDEVPAYSSNSDLRHYLTNIVKYTENLLREQKNHRGRLQVNGLDQQTKRLLDQLIVRAGKVINPPVPVPKLEIDLAQVAKLRAESEEVQSLLQMEGEGTTFEHPSTVEYAPQTDQLMPLTAHDKVSSEHEPAGDNSEDTVWAEFAQALADHQVEVLAAILNDPEPRIVIHRIATAQFLMPTVLIDDINELAQEFVGDILIDSTEVPQFIDDDYIPMLTNIVSQRRS